jgi:hypothetical protein
MICRVALAFALVVVGAASNTTAAPIQLYDGASLAGFTVHGPVSWSGAGGLLQNLSTADDHSFLTYDTPLPSDSFYLEARVSVLEGIRFRLHEVFDQLYVGNEGFIRQFEVYGNQLTNSNQVADDFYDPNVFYTLRLEKDSDGQVRLFQDGVLTHTGIVGSLPPLAITILAGDGFSPGRIQISSLIYGSPVPEPATIALGMMGVVLGAVVCRCRASKTQCDVASEVWD